MAVIERQTPILPGGNNAVLTTSDGSTIILDSMQTEHLFWKVPTKISIQGGLLHIMFMDCFNLAEPKFLPSCGKIGRWYDVGIAYAGKVPIHRFEGKISRDAQLSDLLRILELSNVKFRVVGNKIIVQ